MAMQLTINVSTPLKDNTAQVNLASANGDNAKPVAQKGARKRTLTLMNGVEYDLQNKTLPASKELVEAMRLRILELEDQLAGQQPTKRPRKSTADAPKAGPSGSSAAPSPVVKVETKKINMILKKVWDRLSKEVKSENNKFTGGKEKTIKIEEILENDEFHAIFNGKGVTIQPTATNKPNSTVTIIQFASEERLGNLFGTYYKELKGNRYATGAFMKSAKIGQCDVEVKLLTVTYSKNNMKCAFKFDVDEVGSDYIDCPYARSRMRDYGWF